MKSATVARGEKHVVGTTMIRHLNIKQQNHNKNFEGKSITDSLHKHT